MLYKETFTDSMTTLTREGYHSIAYIIDVYAIDRSHAVEILHFDENPKTPCALGWKQFLDVAKILALQFQMTTEIPSLKIANAPTAQSGAGR